MCQVMLGVFVVSFRNKHIKKTHPQLLKNLKETILRFASLKQTIP